MTSPRLSWALALSGLAVGAAAALWLFKRPSAVNGDEPRRTSPQRTTRYAAIEPAPSSEHQLSARPRSAAPYYELADDYDSLAPEQLGAAFLAGATDTALEPVPSSTAEIPGFRIYEPGAEDPESAEGTNEELASIFGRDP